MIEILKNFISHNEVDKIIDYYRNKEFTEKGYHPLHPNRLQWENSRLDSWIIDHILHDKIVNIVGENYSISPSCGVYQRCYLPFGMHIDSKNRIDPARKLLPNEQEGKALLIPLQESLEFNTVFWDVKFSTDQEKTKAFNEFTKLPAREIKNSRIGMQYDLAFCWDDPHRKLYNHYDVAGIFNWRIGDAAIWDRNLLHAATDFTKKHPYKDAVTIFFE